MRIGIVFVAAGILLGAASTAATVHGHPPALLGLWPAFSFVVVGLGYARLGAKVFGKRSDGTLSPLQTVLLAPYLAVSWLVWRMLRLGRERCWDQVAPGIYLGRRPYARELPEDVRLIVDLTAEFPRSIPRAPKLDYVCLPTLDASVPAETEMRALMDRIMAHPGPMYIHCAQGHGRSAVVAGAVLVARGIARDAGEAEAHMKGIRPGVNMSRVQRRQLDVLASWASSRAR